MNQTLTEHHIAQYNILLIDDQTVNQTKHAYKLGNIAIVFVSHVFSTSKFDLFLTSLPNNKANSVSGHPSSKLSPKLWIITHHATSK